MENKLTAYGDYLAGTEKADNTTALYIREAAAFIQYIGDKTVTKTFIIISVNWRIYLDIPALRLQESTCPAAGKRKETISIMIAW